MKIINQIVLTSDYEGFKDKILAEIPRKNLRFFESVELKIDEARKIVDEAYVAEREDKIIVIAATKFGEEAQNALLKILEEPPKNTVFFLITPFINALLPTIRSRLVVQNLCVRKPRYRTGLNLARLGLKEAVEFIDAQIALERKGELDKTALKALIGEIALECFEAGVRLSGDELQRIDRLSYLAEHNAKAHAVLTPLLLMIEEKR